MIRFYLIIIFLALAAAMSEPALSADAPRKLTLQECMNVRAGLRALDGYQGVDKDGKSAPMQYKLGALRGAIALDAVQLDEVIRAGDQARQALVKENFPGGTPAPGTKEYADFMGSEPYKRFSEAYQKILDAPQSVDVPHIRLGDLRIGDAPDGNPIPTDALTLLAPILDR